MKKSTFTIQIIVLVFLISCTGKKNSNYSEKNIPELFTEAVDCKRKEDVNLIFEKLNDSINTSKSFYLYTKERIDTQSQRIIRTYEIDYDWDHKASKGLSLTINHKYEILFRSEIIKNKDLLIKKTKEYIANPNYDAHLPEKKSDSVKYFGIYDISNQVFFVYGSFKQGYTKNKTPWDGFINLIRNIEESYIQLRNELSQRKWGKDFNKLEFDKQLSIRKIYPFRIYIILDYDPICIPPPEPFEIEDFKE